MVTIPADRLKVEDCYAIPDKGAHRAPKKRQNSTLKLTDATGRLMLREKWAAVVDTVGGDILATAIKSTRYGGIVTCCGNVASADLFTSVYPFILRGCNLMRR